MRRIVRGERLVEMGLIGLPLLASSAFVALVFRQADAIKALVLLFSLCAVLSTIVRLKEMGLKRNPIKAACLLGFVFWYSYPAFVSFLFRESELEPAIYESVSSEAIAWAILYLTIFYIGFSISSAAVEIQLNLRSHKGIRANPARPVWVAVLAMCGCIAGLAVYFILGDTDVAGIVVSIMAGRTVDKPWMKEGHLGDSVSYFSDVAGSVMIGSVVMLWTVVIDKRISRWLRIPVGFVAAASSAIIYLDQGTRSVFALAVAPAWLMIGALTYRRSRRRGLCVYVAAVATFVILLQFQLLYRASFTREDVSGLILREWFTLGGSIDFFKETVFAVALVPSTFDYFKESSLMHFVSAPIPRFLWPGKPVSVVVESYTVARWDMASYLRGGSALPGIVGQYYMSWGWIGVLAIGVTLGCLASWVERWLRVLRRSVGIYASTFSYMVAIWFFLTYRLVSPVFLYPVMVCGLIVLLARAGSRQRLGVGSVGAFQKFRIAG